MGIQEKILTYLSVYGKENTYRIASALKLNGMKVTKALKKLEEEGKIEMKGGRAFLVKGKKPITTKTKERKKQPKVKIKEKQKEESETEISTKPIKTEEEKIEGTVKFYNPNKGFGFITGDDGKDYYVHKTGLKKGVTIDANDRVSFKPIEGDKGPKAEEIEWISQA